MAALRSSPRKQPPPLPVARFSTPWLQSLPSLPPSLPTFDDPVEAPRSRIAAVERRDRMGPALAGALVGAFAGSAALVALEAAIERLTALGAPSLVLSHMLAGDRDGYTARAVAFLLAVGAGMVLGAAFALLTRRLRRFAFLTLWSLVAWPAATTALYAFALPRLAPTFAAQVPFIPAVLASVAFALVLPMELPLRARGGVPRNR